MGEVMSYEIDSSTKQRETLLNLMKEVLESLSIKNLIKDKIKYENNKLYLNNNEYAEAKNIYIFGFGKSSAAMAEQIEFVFGNNIKDGIIITKDGYEKKLKKIEVLSGSHPYPDKRTIKNSEKFLEKIKNVEENSTVIFLISGGGSALFEKPELNINLSDIETTNQILLESGLDIKNINIIRKHISSVKGGKLLKYFKNKRVKIFNFIISDVANNDLSTIASGPTNYDDSTFKNAYEIIKNNKLENKIPKKIVSFIKNNIDKTNNETLKSIEFENFEVVNFFISKVEEAVLKTYNILREKNKNVYILSSDLYGDSFEAGKFTSSMALEVKKYNRPFEKPCYLISGGETTVSIRNKYGVGGPNKEFVLGFVNGIKNEKNITQIAIDTDGTDGPCNSAGAIGDYKTYKKIKDLYNFDEIIYSNNTEKIFDRIKDLIVTGPTESNLNDLRITLIE